MQPLLIILLLLSVLTNVLLILLLLRSGQQNTAEDQTDEIARIVRDEVEAETEVLADQLRVMQGEVTRTTSASARDMGTLLAESQRQSQEAATARLDAIAEENGITIEYEVTSGQGDQTVLRQLSDQAIADGVDAIIPIATTAAQIAALSAEETKTPVVYAAVSDPETAKLTGIDYVTGTSDALNTQSIMDMMFAVQPDIQTVGLLYSNSEANSTTPIAEAKAYLDAKGIAYVEKTGNTYVTEHVVGIGKAEGVPQEIVDGLRANFEGECSEVGMYLAMARVAEREGYPEIAEAYKRYAYEEADHASRFAELLGEVVTDSTKKNLMMRAEAECGACAGKMDLAKKAKALNLDAIHDTVHEMAKDEARHGRGFEGLLKRYFNTEV